MFIPPTDRVSMLFDGGSSIVPPLQLDKPSRFSLDMAGVTSLLGGDDAVSAMAMVHIYGNRRWLGWYNNPGSFQIAERFSSLAKSTSSRSISGRDLPSTTISKSVHLEPTTLFEMDYSKGPKFHAAHSGTVMEETSYLASLFMKECAAWDSEGKVVPGRRTQPVSITIADLSQAPACEMNPAHSSASALLFAGIPIVTSITTCAICAVCQDWYASSLIFAGIVANGVSCFVLGSVDLIFTHPGPAKGSPAGDGILSSDKDIVLVRGTEGAVNSITRGRLSLRFPNESHRNLMWWCSILFFIQSITQILLIPQASLFGQVVFLISLGISALCNAWLSSLDKEKIHRKLLFEQVLKNPTLTRYTLGTRTTAVVFMLLVLQLQDPSNLLDELLPNDTKVWKQWKVMILEQLRHPRDRSFLSGCKLVDVDGFTQEEHDLLELLYGDARAAYNGYMDYLEIDSL